MTPTAPAPHLDIVLLQRPLQWENPEANRLMFEQAILGLAAPAHLIVLPEMFTTGFSMDPNRIAEPTGPNSPTTLWMLRMAAHTGAVICGSISARVAGRHVNRLLWARPDGTLGHYDKRHLFTFGGEHLHYAPGTERPIFHLHGWRICPLICYDLRFPVWSRNSLILGRPAYDLLLYVANWPAVRRGPWQQLLPARAIENLSYVAGLNRTGTDAQGHEYAGDSIILGPWGQTLADAPPHTPAIITARLSRALLDDFRQKFPALEDADGFSLDPKFNIQN